jgi:hypothetical protein
VIEKRARHIHHQLFTLLCTILSDLSWQNQMKKYPVWIAPVRVKLRL